MGFSARVLAVDSGIKFQTQAGANAEVSDPFCSHGVFSLRGGCIFYPHVAFHSKVERLKNITQHWFATEVLPPSRHRRTTRLFNRTTPK